MKWQDEHEEEAEEGCVYFCHDHPADPIPFPFFFLTYEIVKAHWGKAKVQSLSGDGIT